ncbi:hypothetical protein FRB99_002390 [Tulasnella sp. 403]|nr:hypothetical protein FRB99_002390 [Tulasnella sp. 403]
MVLRRQTILLVLLGALCVSTRPVIGELRATVMGLRVGDDSPRALDVADAQSAYVFNHSHKWYGTSSPIDGRMTDVLRRRGEETATPTPTQSSPSATSASASATSTNAKKTPGQKAREWFLNLMPWDLYFGFVIIGAGIYGLCVIIRWVFLTLKSCFQYCGCCKQDGNLDASSVIGPSSSAVNLPGQITIPPAPIAPPVLPPAVVMIVPPGIPVPPLPATLYNNPDAVGSMSMTDVGVGIAAPPPVGLAILVPPRPLTFAASTTMEDIAMTSQAPASPLASPTSPSPEGPKTVDTQPTEPTNDPAVPDRGLGLEGVDVGVWIRHASLVDDGEAPEESSSTPIPLVPKQGDNSAPDSQLPPEADPSSSIAPSVPSEGPQSAKEPDTNTTS